MTFYDLQTASEEELKREAIVRYDEALETKLWDRRTAKLLEAQFYMDELNRKHEERMAKSLFPMKVRMAIIFLIGLEGLAAVYGITAASKESRKQAVVMERIVKRLDQVEARR